MEALVRKGEGLVETSPLPRGYPYKFDFRADHANITMLAWAKGNRKYFLKQPYSKIAR